MIEVEKSKKENVLSKVTVENILKIDDESYIATEDINGGTIYFDRIEALGEPRILVTDMGYTHGLYRVADVEAYPDHFIEKVNEQFSNVFGEVQIHKEKVSDNENIEEKSER
jgi:hypothetical protein